ncbi:family 43 glycosylhydrolase [Limibacter armeniacum]|uniref:family 43 glycosylhydrolase n=1 Tax=Limibacter armeniacum TaxID=466084 RepID=UPI002FE638FD
MRMKPLLVIAIMGVLGSCSLTENKSVRVAAAHLNEAVKVDVIVPEHGMADPHAWVQNDTVFIICGHDESWEGKGSFRMDRWEVWSSTDLKNWEHHRNILPSQTYIGDKPNCWAGDVCERDGKYYWFFSNRNINTGVMVADQITGEYRDLLGKPLLPEGIVPVHPYDPEIYIEDGVYTICFGAGTYYMATLSEDMKSLATEPKKILVQDENGNPVKADDKSTLFKRNGWYYLVYGSRYAMAENLYGPYTFKGAFLEGGHTSFFDWHGQLYVLQENHDISAFYRGASLKPVFFNDDQTIYIPEDDRMYPAPGRPWEFKSTTMGWQALKGTDIAYHKGVIAGQLTEKEATVVSAPWLYTDTRECSEITIRMKNSSVAKALKFSIFSRDRGNGFWTSFTEPVDWSKQDWVTIPIKANDTDFHTYTIPISQFKDLKERLMQVAVQPAADAVSGNWEIDEIIVK